MTRDEFDKLYSTKANNNCDGHTQQHYGFWAQQHPDEFWLLVEAVSQINATRILEIGTNHGGSAIFWDHLAGPTGHVVTLDSCSFDGNTASMFNPKFCNYNAVSDFKPLKRNSHAPETRAEMATLFPEGIDFLFIDGDHSYVGCKQDYDEYFSLVRPGGLIACHDILMDADDSKLHCMGVAKFFREVDRPKKAFEIAFGIGLIYM